jgi:hypothetical protein
MPRKKVIAEPEEVTSLGQANFSPSKVDASELHAKLTKMSTNERQKFVKTLSKDEKKAYIEARKDHNCEKVSCIFRCLEPVGGSVVFTAGAYGDIEKYTFLDGEQYTVPRYIVERFNGDFQGCGTWYPTHTNVLDANGKPTVAIGKKNYRFMLSSTNYERAAV